MGMRGRSGQTEDEGLGPRRQSLSGWISGPLFSSDNRPTDMPWARRIDQDEARPAARTDGRRRPPARPPAACDTIHRRVITRTCTRSIAHISHLAGGAKRKRKKRRGLGSWVDLHCMHDLKFNCVRASNASVDASMPSPVLSS